MKTLATRRLSKQHKGMICRICQDGETYFCQFSLTGNTRSAYFTVSFTDIQQASGYLDRCKHKDFDAIVHFLVTLAAK